MRLSLVTAQSRFTTIEINSAYSNLPVRRDSACRMNVGAGDAGGDATHDSELFRGHPIISD
jgi:hypothetical protein